MAEPISNQTVAPPHRFALIGTPGYRLCVAVAAASISAMTQAAAAALIEQPFVELRLDSLAFPVAELSLLRKALAALFSAHPQAQAIATCRRIDAGGGFAGDPSQELSVLEAAIEAGCTLADLAVESAELLGLARVARFRQALHQAGAALMVSAHDFVGGSSQLAATYQRLARFTPDIVKLVSTAVCLSDNLAVLDLLNRPRRLPTVVIAMGDKGLPSRLLGPSRGALFTFASADSGSATAPGQLSAQLLSEQYRFDRISPRTRVFGVAGQPIAHSLSPRMHNAAFALGGVDAVLLPLPTGSAEDLIQLARALPLAGLSVTMPLKQAILPLLDWVDPLTARVGACNTVVRGPDGALRGYNTDVAGVVSPLARRLALKGTRILVQGAGGAARAAVFGLVEQGAQVWVTNRTPSKAQALAEEAGASFADAELPAQTSFDVLVHAVPAGMTSSASISDNTDPGSTTSTPIHAGMGAAIVFEMIYHPLDTPLLRRARAQGLEIVTGAEMFIQQGARQYELWTGTPAPEEAMAALVLDALHARESPGTSDHV